jgi:hypothetical protein
LGWEVWHIIKKQEIFEKGDCEVKPKVNKIYSHKPHGDRKISGAGKAPIVSFGEKFFEQSPMQHINKHV